MSDERASDKGDSDSSRKASSTRKFSPSSRKLSSASHKSPSKNSARKTSVRRLETSPADIVSRGEFDFIERVRRQALKRSGARSNQPSTVNRQLLLSVGIGDDCAVIRGGVRLDTVVTADLLVEDIDFRLSTTTPRMLGHKALAVSLSDVAAMGARPRYALLSIGAPRSLWRGAFLDEFYEGFFTLADEHGVALVGGDVSRTDARVGTRGGNRFGESAPGKLVVDSIVVGEVGRGQAVLRSGARPGDLLFVTGALGGAAAGLLLLERRKRPRGGGASGQTTGGTNQMAGGLSQLKRSTRRDSDARRDSNLYESNSSEADELLVMRQLRPDPRVAWGRFLGERGLTTAMIDVSDGLSSDLAHLCRESRVGARVDASKIPVDPAVARSSLKTETPALDLALGGGEDFELLFTVAPRDASKLPGRLGGVPVTHIGEVTKGAGRIRLVEGARSRPLRPTGFEHF